MSKKIVLGKKVQQYMKLEAIRSALVESMSSSTSESEDDSKADFGDSEIICKTVVEPTREQWAKEAALSVTELNQALEGGKRSRAKMVRCNLRLVVSVAKKVQRPKPRNDGSYSRGHYWFASRRRKV